MARQGTNNILPVENLPSQQSREVNVEYLPKMPEGVRGRKIHPRMDLPFPEEGECVPDMNPSPPVQIEGEGNR